MVVDIKINYRRCTSCKKCVKACTFGVLEWFEEQPLVVNPSKCSACFECKLSCPVDAISIKEK
ncbi:MAG TPA: 4Fe-4S dicluster domain-containing protein [Candidatus Bathyarchaeota archaeon]|nr:4Fe-4S dicluster domain-containing protein [Candidatus Bathyarchaeota archaeon]